MFSETHCVQQMILMQRHAAITLGRITTSVHISTIPPSLCPQCLYPTGIPSASGVSLLLCAACYLSMVMYPLHALAEGSDRLAYKRGSSPAASSFCGRGKDMRSRHLLLILAATCQKNEQCDTNIGYKGLSMQLTVNK